MIKRIYPRMSTAEFVTKAIAIHGDLYDYSESVYDGLKEPFSFGCKRCGTTRTLSQAGTHIRKIRPCGCKPCNHDNLSPCKICGVGVSSKVYHRQAKRCEACCDQAKADRAKRIEEKHGKHCKACGTWFVYKDRFYCSKECSQNRPKKVCRKTCDYCRSEFERSLSSEKGQRFNFCSVACQNAFQRASYFQYQNETPRPISKSRTRNARSKWYTERRRQRRKNSQSANWWSKCLDCSSRIMRSVEISEWDRRCDSAASITKKRREPVFKLESIRVLTWDKTIGKNRNRLLVDHRPKEQIEWSNKINRTTRSCKRRLAARSKNDTGLFGTKTEEIRQGLLPFAE